MTARIRGGVSFHHEKRTTNEEAHRLARLGMTLQVGRHVWLVSPTDELNLPVNITTNE